MGGWVGMYYLLIVVLIIRSKSLRRMGFYLL